MSYDALIYVFVFVPVCLGVYQLAPGKHRWKVLLAFSWIFFYLVSGELLVYLILATLVTYYTGICLAWLGLEEQAQAARAGADRRRIKEQYRRRRRAALAMGIILLLSALVYLKYHDFFVRTVNMLPGAEAFPLMLAEKDLILPVGISFYTLQAIGYMADVYWGKTAPEKNPGKAALFLAFFPHIMEGPICRYSDTSGTLFAGKPLDPQNLSDGYMRIFWGLFKKKVVADRLAVPVAAVFDNYTQYSGVFIAVGAIAYTIQLYMEFSGCMDIVIGTGKLFGVCLPENFRQPFCANSAAEFWRRWHITLGTWFKTYIFYPVSMSGAVKRWNQFGRKHLGKYVTQTGVAAAALFPVWLCNGLWHGARWSYIFYGMYYFTLILAGEMIKPLRNGALRACRINEESAGWRFIRVAKTWVIIFTGELFFRADGLRAGIHMFRSMFRDFDLSRLWDGSLLDLGLAGSDIAAAAAGCVVVAIAGHFLERNKDAPKKLAALPVPVRWFAYYALILSVVIFAAYGDGYQAVDMIYAGF